MVHVQDASTVSQYHIDEEKTIRAEESFTDKKDFEGTKPSSIAGSIKEGKCTVDAAVVEDDFPEGGLRAWLVVLGVRVKPNSVLYAVLGLFIDSGRTGHIRNIRVRQRLGCLPGVLRAELAVDYVALDDVRSHSLTNNPC
jgi:hypothetical protein